MRSPYPTSPLSTTDNKITAGPVADRITTVSRRKIISGCGAEQDSIGGRFARWLTGCRVTTAVMTYLRWFLGLSPSHGLLCYVYQSLGF